jgi:hypothetical protein
MQQSSRSEVLAGGSVSRYIANAKVNSADDGT